MFVMAAAEGDGFPKMFKEGSRSKRGQGLTMPAPPRDELEDKSDLKSGRNRTTRASGVGKERKASATKRKETGDMVQGLEAAAAAAAAADTAAASAGVGAKGDGWVTIRLDSKGSDEGDGLGGLEENDLEEDDEEEDYDEEGDDEMEARLR